MYVRPALPPGLLPNQGKDIEAVADSLKKKHFELDVAAFNALEARRKESDVQTQNLQAEKKKASKKKDKKKKAAEGEEAKDEDGVEASDDDDKNRVVFKPAIADCR